MMKSLRKGMGEWMNGWMDEWSRVLLWTESLCTLLRSLMERRGKVLGFVNETRDDKKPCCCCWQSRDIENGGGENEPWRNGATMLIAFNCPGTVVFLHVHVTHPSTRRKTNTLSKLLVFAHPLLASPPRGVLSKHNNTLTSLFTTHLSSSRLNPLTLTMYFSSIHKCP